jgi:type IV secretory pathway VirB10-like protein
LVFRAKQVLERDNGKSGKKALPTGSNLIGKLLTTIDSRDLSSPIKVLIPYGGKFQGEEFIEKNTVFIGKASYSGKGERVFISFDRAILPSGQEKSITASALDSSDYSNGIVGDVHSETGMRIAGSLGLTMVSSMSDVLTEKTAHGESGVVIPKANIRNAAFQGVSKISAMEASRQAETIAQTPPYITLDAGIDLIVTLGAIYGAENEQQ